MCQYFLDISLLDLMYSLRKDIFAWKIPMGIKQLLTRPAHLLAFLLFLFCLFGLGGPEAWSHGYNHNNTRVNNSYFAV